MKTAPAETRMLEPTSDEVRQWAAAATETIVAYLATIRERRLYPTTTSGEIREKLDRALPRESSEFAELLGTFRDVVLEMSRHNAHPRMFGYVASPGTTLGSIADLLASALNANLTAWRSAPVAVELERLTIDWIKEIIGYDRGAGGLFVSGGSIANLSALAAARRAKAPSNFAQDGAATITRRMRLYASTETHHSIEKAAGLLGIGKNNVRLIAVDETGRIRVDQLMKQIEQDEKAGDQPFCVVANAGTVGTGAFDSLGEIADVAARFQLWMHVDACYGGFAALAPSARHFFRDLARADSVSLDPHKWLYVPVDCGCVLYRDPETARATFAHEAEYTRVMNQEADEAFAFWDYGPELSRRFRALKVWMMLQGIGTQALSEAVEKDLSCARHLQQLVEKSRDFEMLSPVELSIFCFRYLPEKWRDKSADHDAREAALDAFNEKLLVALQRDGSSYLSNAKVNGRFALRGCVINFRTTLQDMERLLDDLRRVAQQLEK